MSVQFENKITLGNALTIIALASLAPIVAVASDKTV